MAAGTYKIPKPFKDEDKWFKLTKKQILYLTAGGLLAVGAIRIFSMLGIAIIGWVVGISILLFSILLSSVAMPLDKYIIGGGISLEILAVRVITKRFPGRRNLYIKNYEKQED